MADVILNENHLKNIANAIREKNGLSTQYFPSEMASAIRDIQVGGGKKVETGTTTSTIINTGLSSVDTFIIYTEELVEYGMMSAICKPNSAVINACTYYSQWGQKDCKIHNVTSAISISGGTVRWTATGDGQNFMEGATYNWIAVGE